MDGEKEGKRRMNEGRRGEKTSKILFIQNITRGGDCLQIRLAGSVSISARRGLWSVLFRLSIDCGRQYGSEDNPNTENPLKVCEDPPQF